MYCGFPRRRPPRARCASAAQPALASITLAPGHSARGDSLTAIRLAFHARLLRGELDVASYLCVPTRVPVRGAWPHGRRVLRGAARAGRRAVSGTRHAAADAEPRQDRSAGVLLLRLPALQ